MRFKNQLLRRVVVGPAENRISLEPQYVGDPNSRTVILFDQGLDRPGVMWAVAPPLGLAQVVIAPPHDSLDSYGQINLIAGPGEDGEIQLHGPRVEVDGILAGPSGSAYGLVTVADGLDLTVTQPLIQTKKEQANTNGAGIFTINFTPNFLNGLVIAQAWIAHAGNSIAMSRTAGDNASASFYAYDAPTGAPIVSSSFFVDWLAIGY